MRQQIEKLTKLNNHKFAVKYKGDRKTYMVDDTDNDLILAFLVAGIVNN